MLAAHAASASGRCVAAGTCVSSHVASGVSYRPKVGDVVSAQPFPCDGAERVEGVVLDVRGSIVLLDRPHGRWVPLDGVEPLPGVASRRAISRS
jgi:hypothetical protein